MDSGSAVPTLNPGLSMTVAAKLLSVASGRCGEGAGASLVKSGRSAVAGAAPPEFMLLRKARFLAADRAGRSSPASTAIMAITASSSISVNARRRYFIRCLVGFLDEISWMRNGFHCFSPSA